MTQVEALTILKTGANVFLTGEPGSGKTHTINEFTAWLRAAGIEPSITAATGIAATHVSGMTLHSWSGIGVLEHASPAEIDRIATKENIARRVGKAKVLIIDEISMLSAATFEAADAICKAVRRDERPFGGLVVVVVGDFFQLPPVSRRGDVQFAYQSAAWRALNPIVCYLTEQHRQDDDSIFLALLSAIRAGDVEEMHFEALTSRNTAAGEVPKGIPQLYSHNTDVDRVNANELAKLPGNAKTFLMTSSGREALVEGLKRGCLSPETLELKKGAAVMFTKNSPQGRFANGTLGAVADFDKATGMPCIATRYGTTILVEPMEWQVVEDGKVRASVSQVPLRLAYAMTVHKSQGMSMDAAAIDLSRAFEYGQGYVALSRVRTLEGLHLLGVNARALEIHPAVRQVDSEFRAAAAAAQEAFEKMGVAEIETMQKQFVKAEGGAWPGAGTKIRGKAVGAIPARLAATLQAARDEKTLTGVTIARGLALSTVVSHLEELAEIDALALADFAHLMPDQKIIDEITAALTTSGDGRLAPVFTKLRGRYPYETIRLVRLCATGKREVEA